MTVLLDPDYLSAMLAAHGARRDIEGKDLSGLSRALVLQLESALRTGPVPAETLRVRLALDGGLPTLAAPSACALELTLPPHLRPGAAGAALERLLAEISLRELPTPPPGSAAALGHQALRDLERARHAPETTAAARALEACAVSREVIFSATAESAPAAVAEVAERLAEEGSRVLLIVPAPAEAIRRLLALRARVNLDLLDAGAISDAEWLRLVQASLSLSALSLSARPLSTPDAALDLTEQAAPQSGWIVVGPVHPDQAGPWRARLAEARARWNCGTVLALLA